MLSLRLEALAVDDGRTALVVLLLRDPHLLEGRERCENGATNPDGVFTLRRSNDLDLHRRGSERSDFLLHTIGDTWVHGGTARLENVRNGLKHQIGDAYHDNVSVEILPHIDVALHDGVESGDVDTTALKTEHAGLEESFRSSESLVANRDDLTVRKFVRLLQTRALRGGLNFLLEVKGNIAQLLLDISDDFALGSGREGVTALSQDLHEVIGQITTCHVDTRDSVRKSETFVDGDNVSDTIAGVKHDTSGTTGGIEGEDSLNRDVEGGGVEGFEDDLGHLLSVGLGVDGGLGEQNGVLLGSHTQLIVEGVMPNLLHIVPVGDHTVLDGISEGEDTTLGLGLITDIRVFLTHTNHDTVMTRTTDNGSYQV